MVPVNMVETIRQKYELLSTELDERRRRLWAASEAQALGHGGVAAVATATGLAESTIRLGQRELRHRSIAAPSRPPTLRSDSWVVDASPSSRMMPRWYKRWRRWWNLLPAATRCRRCAGHVRVRASWPLN